MIKPGRGRGRGRTVRVETKMEWGRRRIGDQDAAAIAARDESFDMATETQDTEKSWSDGYNVGISSRIPEVVRPKIRR